MEDQTDTPDDDWEVYIKIAQNLKDIINKFRPVKYKKGFGSKSVAETIPQVYIKVLFKLLELILLDVAAGTVVVGDKKRNSRFYVGFMPAHPNMIAGKGWKEKEGKDRIPKIDLHKLNYKVPIFAYDTGHPKSFPAMVRAPKYIYSVLVENANSGVKYAKVNKKFWWEIKKE